MPARRPTPKTLHERVVLMAERYEQSSAEAVTSVGDLAKGLRASLAGQDAPPLGYYESPERIKTSLRDTQYERDKLLGEAKELRAELERLRAAGPRGALAERFKVMAQKTKSYRDEAIERGDYAEAATHETRRLVYAGELDLAAKTSHQSV
jgi:hypothetical protein